MTEITLLTYVKVFQEKKHLILLAVLLSTLVMGTVILLTPRSYTARATTFPPANSTNILKGWLGTVSPTIGGNPTSVESLTYLVKSRRMAEGIVDRFELPERFRTSRESAIRKAIRMVKGYDLSRGTVFVIEATAHDPRLSSEIANFCVENLNAINQQMGLTTEKPMLKVIDAARIPEDPNPRHLLKKVMSTILFSGVGMYFFFFLAEYLFMLREEERRRAVTEDAEKILEEV